MTASDNVLEAMSHSVCVLDSSFTGLCGFLFAPSAPENLSTEYVVYRLQVSGVEVTCEF